MKRLALLFSPLFAASLYANPCAAVCYANPSGTKIIRVRAVDGKLNATEVHAVAAQLGKAGWDRMGERLQAKLGSRYRVTVIPAAGFNQHGHDCP